MNDLTEVEDEDFQLGMLDPIAAILKGLGCRTAGISENGIQLLASTWAGHDFDICTPVDLADKYCMYVFVAKFPGFQFSHRSANHWNYVPVGVVASLDEQGGPQLTYTVLRNELSAKAFAKHLDLWLTRLDVFGGRLSNPL